MMPKEKKAIFCTIDWKEIAGTETGNAVRNATLFGLVAEAVVFLWAVIIYGWRSAFITFSVASLIVAPIIIIGIIFEVDLIKSIVSQIRIRENRCWKCGYPLASTGKQCPECGLDRWKQ